MRKKLNIKELKNFFYNKRVVITGHTGFKGIWLSAILKNFGAKVYGYSLKPNNKLNLYYLVTWNWKINETSIKTEEAMVMEIFYHILHQLHFLNRD